MHFYGMTDDAVLGMPIRRFWLLSGCVERIMAQQDLRALTVANSAQNAEGATEVRQRLVIELGDVYALEEMDRMERLLMENERDQAGFDELKAMAAIMK